MNSIPVLVTASPLAVITSSLIVIARPLAVIASSLIVIASAARQSIARWLASMDCHVATLLAMTDQKLARTFATRGIL